MAIGGVLFDKDGTLFDFRATWLGVTERLLDALAPSPEARAEMALGAGFDPVGRRFLPGAPMVSGATRDVAELWARHRPDLGAAGIEEAANRAAILAAADPGMLVPAAPDLAALLGTLGARGLALGVATHDSEEGAEVQLAAAGVRAAFAFVAGYDSGHRPKPAPDMLLAFAAKAGIAPSAVVMVGDSVHDLMMVRSAGAAIAVGVLTGPAGHDDLAPAADHVIPSIADLPALLDRLYPRAA